MNKLLERFQNEAFKSRFLLETKRIFFVVVFTFIYGVGVSWFLEASVVPLYAGGIPGVGQLIRDIIEIVFKIQLPEQFLGVFIFVANIPLLLLGWFGVSHRFTIYSLISVVIQASVLSFIPVFDMGLSSEVHALASAVLGGLLVGIGAGGALRFGTSTGGLDIIAQFISFKKGHSVGFITMVMNVVMAILGGIIIGGRANLDGVIISGGVIASYTVIRIIISTIITDRMHTAYHYLSVNIITVNPNDLVDAILTKLYRGVTLMKVEGAYSHHEKTMVYVVISAYELHSLVNMVKRLDETAFITTTPVKQVFGNFKRKTIA